MPNEVSAWKCRFCHRCFGKKSGAVKMDEVFLPYLSDGKKTLYQAYVDGQLALPEGAERDS